MKKILLTAIFALATLGIASAQKYIVINSEKVFKSLEEYNTAMAKLDQLGKAYQAEVDNKYKSVEQYYNNYMAQRNNLSSSARASMEQQILKMEQEAQQLQQQLLGEEGTLMKKRVELIQPIQTKVFAAIEKFAKENGFDLVLDTATNASILYFGSAVDRTGQIIALLKK